MLNKKIKREVDFSNKKQKNKYTYKYFINISYIGSY
jgi:hypothetical protein